jgi:hypothetical protein
MKKLRTNYTVIEVKIHENFIKKKETVFNRRFLFTRANISYP